jgi:hypothetical protein
MREDLVEETSRGDTKKIGVVGEVRIQGRTRANAENRVWNSR